MLDNGTARDVFRLAAQVGRVDVVQYLLEKGLNKDAADGNGWTALNCATFNGHMNVVQLLVEQ